MSETTLPIRYTRSGTYAEAPLHGIYGGVSSTGQIVMTLYSERPALPSGATLTITRDDETSLVTSFEDVPIGNEGIERNLQSTYFLDVNFAQSMIAWLQDKVDAFENMSVQE